jgi:hypothetical protein
MSTTQESHEDATQIPSAETVDTKFEAVVIPGSDVDRSKRFCGSLGWRLDADFAFDNGFRVVRPDGTSGRVSAPAPDHARDGTLHIEGVPQ